MSGQRTRTDVLVVGGGLVGLTTALLLRRYGVGVTLVERRTATSPQPKARRLHMRSMEVFRDLGLAGLVHEAARDLAGHDHMATGPTLAEARQLPLHVPAGPGGAVLEASPELPCLLSQDLLEPLLREAAVAAGADVRFCTELVQLHPAPDEVGADLLAGGRTRTVAARYVVAADGARSPVREALGVTRSGNGFRGDPAVNVYFTADLAATVRGRGFNLCRLTGDVPGGLASVDGRRRWVFMAPGAAADRDWPALLRRALGVPAPDLEVLSVLSWRSEMLVADRYAAGRVFLAGDAAHVMPPFAASGANTGIADAHALAWRLAAVLDGSAGSGLLDSYDTERRPAGWFAADQSSRRTAHLKDRTVPDPSLAHPYVLAAGGFQYPAGALVPRPGEEPEPVTRYEPRGRVGTRVPHRWLDQDRTVSTVDLAGPGWAVLAGETAPIDGVQVPVHRAGVDFLAPDELVLLRPDDVVAWRGTDPAAATDAYASLLAARAVTGVAPA